MQRMSSEYPGYPRIAHAYWRYYSRIVAGFVMLTLFTGVVGALLVVSFIPSAKWYYGLAAVSFIIHSSAVTVRDILKGDYEPSQTTYSSAKAMLALIVVIGVMISTLLLIATAGASAISNTGLPLWLAAVFAAYYPMVDMYLTRKGVFTPANLTVWVTIELLVQAINIHHTVLQAVPMIGKRRRPQS